MEYNIKDIVYASETIEFVTVAVEYCIFLETFESLSTEDFTDKMTKMLPLLYLKAQLVPEVEVVDEGLGISIESLVAEEDYNFIQSKATVAMGEYNDYLEVFVDDMQYSDEPILAHIAENITDIYQDLRNFVAIYERGVEEHMNDALYVCINHFESYWGQTLTNVLRALHAVKYSSNSTPLLGDEDYEEPNYDEEEW